MNINELQCIAVIAKKSMCQEKQIQRRKTDNFQNHSSNFEHVQYYSYITFTSTVVFTSVVGLLTWWYCTSPKRTLIVPPAILTVLASLSSTERITVIAAASEVPLQIKQNRCK